MIAAVATVVGLAAIAAFLLWLNRRVHCHHCHEWFSFKPGQAQAAWIYHYEYAACERQS